MSRIYITSSHLITDTPSVSNYKWLGGISDQVKSEKNTIMPLRIRISASRLHLRLASPSPPRDRSLGGICVSISASASRLPRRPSSNDRISFSLGSAGHLLLANSWSCTAKDLQVSQAPSSSPATIRSASPCRDLQAICFSSPAAGAAPPRIYRCPKRPVIGSTRQARPVRRQHLAQVLQVQEANLSPMIQSRFCRCRCPIRQHLAQVQVLLSFLQ